jgi:DNA-directed RNA polymerase subunit omega
MDPLIVFDAQRAIPSPFSLAIAAAARARALSRGADPRCSNQAPNPSDLALREIAAVAFKPDEIDLFLLAGSRARKDRRCARRSRQTTRRRATRARFRTRPAIQGGSLAP